MGTPLGWRSDARFWAWEAMVRLRHLFGVHTFIDVELWEGEPLASATIIAQECWLCPART